MMLSPSEDPEEQIRRPKFRTWQVGDHYENVPGDLIENAKRDRAAAVSVLKQYLSQTAWSDFAALEVSGLPYTSSHFGVCAFVDVSGFSVLCETLHRHATNLGDVMSNAGLEGAEFARDLLNTYFGSVMRRFRERGGDIVKVAGDAIVVVWTCDTEEDLPQLASFGLSSCWDIVKEFYQKDIYGFELSLHIGVGAGTFKMHYVGETGDRWFYICDGEAVKQSVEAMEVTHAGELAVTERVWDLVKHLDKLFIVEKEDGTNFIVQKVPPDGIEVPPVARLARHISGTEVSLEIEARWLHSYANPAILFHLHTSFDSNVSDLRLVSILFMRIEMATTGDFLSTCQLTINEIQSTVTRCAGNIKEFGLDDKGLVLVVGFGVPPQSHSNDASRACEASVELLTRMSRLGLSVAIGLTTGEVFCGSIGYEHRWEYGFVGTVVNRSARLMMLAQKRGVGIVVDSATQSAASSAFVWVQWSPVQLKGMREPSTVFQLKGTQREETFLDLPVLVGRELEVNLLRGVLDEHLQINEGLCFIIEAEIGSGKSALLKAAAFLSTHRATTICWLKGSCSPCWGNVLSQILGFHSAEPVTVNEIIDYEWLSGEIDELFCDGGETGEKMKLICDEIVRLDQQPTIENAETITSHIMSVIELLCSAGYLSAELCAISPLLLLIDDAHLLSSSMWCAVNALIHKRGKIIMAMEPNLVTATAHGQTSYQTSKFESDNIVPSSTAHWVYRKLRSKAEKWFRDPETHELQTALNRSAYTPPCSATPSQMTDRSTSSFSPRDDFHVKVLKLGGLGIEDAKRLVARIAESEECDENLAKYLVERTQGNPMFIIEWLSALQASGFVRISNISLVSPPPILGDTKSAESIPQEMAFFPSTSLTPLGSSANGVKFELPPAWVSTPSTRHLTDEMLTNGGGPSDIFRRIPDTPHMNTSPNNRSRFGSGVWASRPIFSSHSSLGRPNGPFSPSNSDFPRSRLNSQSSTSSQSSGADLSSTRTPLHQEPKLSPPTKNEPPPRSQIISALLESAPRKSSPKIIISNFKFDPTKHEQQVSRRIATFVPGCNYGVHPRAPHAIVAMINSWIDVLSPNMSLILKIASMMGREINVDLLHKLCVPEIESWKKLPPRETRYRLLKNLRSLCSNDILRETTPDLRSSVKIENVNSVSGPRRMSIQIPGLERGNSMSSMTGNEIFEFRWLLLQDSLYSHVSFEERQWVHWALADHYWDLMMKQLDKIPEGAADLFHALATLFDHDHIHDIGNFAQHVNHAVLAQEHMHALNMVSIAPAGVIDAYLIDQTTRAFNLSPNDVDGIRSHLPLVPWLKGLYSMAQTGNVRTFGASAKILPRSYFQTRAEEARKRHAASAKAEHPKLHIELGGPEEILPVWVSYRTPVVSPPQGSWQIPMDQLQAHLTLDQNKSIGKTPTLRMDFDFSDRSNDTTPKTTTESPTTCSPSPHSLPLPRSPSLSNLHFPSPMGATARIFFDFCDGDLLAPSNVALGSLEHDDSRSENLGSEGKGCINFEIDIDADVMGISSSQGGIESVEDAFVPSSPRSSVSPSSDIVLREGCVPALLALNLDADGEIFDEN